MSILVIALELLGLVLAGWLVLPRAVIESIGVGRNVLI
jgi:hypothetical protein